MRQCKFNKNNIIPKREIGFTPIIKCICFIILITYVRSSSYGITAIIFFKLGKRETNIIKTYSFF